MASVTKASPALKIGLVLDTSLDPPDGVQQYVVSVGEWLRAQGHDVHYLVGQTEKRQLPNIHSLARNVSVRFNGNRTTIPLPTSRRKLRQFLTVEKFDVLHVQVPYSPFMAQRLIMAAAPQTVVFGTFHVLPYSASVRAGSRLLGAWNNRSAQRFDELVAVSPAAAEFAAKTFHMPSTVLPNTFDYAQFHTAQPLPAYVDDRLTILFLGRLVARKGCLTLLRAVAELVEQELDLPAFRVVICGKGALEAKLKQFVSEHKLDSVVQFTGFVAEVDKPRYYASADISVFPSSGGESFGIVLLEAMASGRAVVLAGDNPGYRSVLGAQPELLFDPTSSKALAILLAEHLRDPALRHRLAKWGETDSERYDTSRIGSQLVRRYRQALRKRRTP